MLIIKVLGTGCKNCEKLENELICALAELEIDADVEKITDMKTIMTHEVSMIPAVVINDKEIVSGKVPNRDIIKEMIKQEV